MNVTFPNPNSIVALDKCSLTINKHEFFSIIGPSGCGKTTFLRVLAGLTPPSSGKVLINGSKATTLGSGIAVVFQEHVLMPWRTALGNVAFGLEFKNVTQEARKKKAKEMIQLVGLEGFEDSYPYELSGGMRQRIGLARALAVNPKILLMDEPFGSVDAQTRELMQDELLRIWRHEKKTVVFVTHSIEEAIYLSDRIAIMTPRPGHIKEVIDVDFSRPRNYSQKGDPKFAELRFRIWKKLGLKRDLSERRKTL